MTKLYKSKFVSIVRKNPSHIMKTFQLNTLSLLLLLMLFGLQTNAQSLELLPFATGYSKPVDISNTGVHGDTRLFITEKDGKIKIVLSDGTKLTTPFLDIDPRVNSSANERGLLGLCFDPSYASNGYFYVHYTNSNGHSTISRFSVTAANPNVADPNSEKILLVVNQPFNNHNAGDLDFGPDGYLYIGMGDGGSGGDPGNRSQNPKTLLGKMLRIDVRTESAPYLIPNDNPFVNNTDTLPEIWALGLRNPWRFSFDTLNNEIWIADVGQDKWEEVNVASINDAGLNYGWKCYEGLEGFSPSLCNNVSKLHFPVSTYANKFDTGCSITGGYVYRGKNYPGLYGKYIFTDFCTGIFWALYKDENGNWIRDEIADHDNMEYATFGVDITGEMYVAGLANGTVFKLVSEPSSSQEITPIGLRPFVISPNPAQNYITLMYEDESLSKGNWSIYTINDIVLDAKIISQTEKSAVIDIHHLPSGVYIIRSDKSTYVQKFVKH